MFRELCANFNYLLTGNIKMIFQKMFNSFIYQDISI